MENYFSQLPEGTLLPFVTSFSREITLFLRQGNLELLAVSNVSHSNQSHSRYPITDFKLLYIVGYLHILPGTFTGQVQLKYMP